jgi:hypothetical protein
MPRSGHDVFVVAAPIAPIGCLIVLTLREQPLRGRTSGAVAAANNNRRSSHASHPR